MEEASNLNLRWNDHTLTFVHLLDQFRLQELYCDASLACAGGVYMVHKVVLSACSDFFASIFASASCKNPVVVLQDVPREHLEALLTYVYRGEVLLARHDLSAFLKVAESLQVKGLARPTFVPFPRDTYGSSTTVSPTFDALEVPTSNPSPLTPQIDPPPPSYPVISAPSASFGASLEEEWDAGNSASLQMPPAATGRSQEAEGDSDHLRPPRKRYSPHFITTDQAGGTFLNLVASEEEEIKEEPPEEDACDVDRLTIYEEEVEDMREEEEEKKREEKEEEEEMDVKEEQIKEHEEENKRTVDERQEDDGGRQDRREEEDEEKEDKREEDKERSNEKTGEEKIEVKILLNAREYLLPLSNIPTTTATLSPSSSLSTHSPTPSLPTHSPTPAHHINPPTSPSNSLSPIPANLPHSPTLLSTKPPTPSQLRRELLKPVQQRMALPFPSPQPPHLAIPHPVIASREGNEMVTLPRTGLEMVLSSTKDLPPLLKMSPTSPLPVPSSSSSSSLSQYHISSPYHHQYHHPKPYQSNGRDSTTTASTSTTSASTSLKNHHNHHHHNHHHLLVTSPPTYKTRLPPQPTATPLPTPPPPSHYPITPYKSTHLMDITDTPLNLSQQDAQHRHRNTATHANQDRGTRDRDPFLGKILTNRKRRLRGPKSWEYLVRLLRDPSTNPTLIRWENESKGVFRLVQPAAIAQRWGRRTGKHASDCLSYENFARGLRYHYATGALQPVSEKSFVYKFGPKALKALGDGECEVMMM